MPTARRAPRARNPQPPRQEGGVRTQRNPTTGGNTLVAPGVLVGVIPVATVIAGAGTAALTKAQIEDRTRNVLKGLTSFSRVRAVALSGYVEDAIQEVRPKASRDEVSAHARHEVAYETEFRRRQAVRVRSSLPKALAIADPAERLRRVDAILKRERDISSAREEAVAARASGRADALTVRDLEPDGPFWVLGRRANHTPDCVALAGRAWPWQVLTEFRMIPPVHTGCGCRLLTRAEAVLEGLATTLPVVVPIAEARRLVAAAVRLHPHDHPPPLLEAMALQLGGARAA